MEDYLWLFQLIALVAPSLITMAVHSFGYLSGKKTNINGVFLVMLPGIESQNFEWLPSEIAAPLATGLAIALLLANTVMTKRK